MFAAIARFSYRYRWAVLIVVGVLVPFAAVYGSGAVDALKPGGYDDPTTESFKARELALEQFGVGGADLVVLYSAATDIRQDADVSATIAAALDSVTGDDDVLVALHFFNTGAVGFLSSDGTRTFATFSLAGDENARADTILRIEPSLIAEGVVTQFGGEIPAFEAFNETIERDLRRAELIAFPITAILLILIFRTLVAAALPLILGGIAIVFALALLRLIASVTDVSAFAMNVVTILGLGMAIDYSLFILNRYREETIERDPEEAIIVTLTTTGKTVAFSGITLWTSLLGLFFFPQNFLRSMAIGGIAVAILAILIALTVLPALIAVLGPRIESLRVPFLPQDSDEAESGGSGFWHTVAFAVMRRPALVAVLVTGFLVLLGTPFLRLNPTTQDVRALDTSFEVREVDDLLNSEFLPHLATPHAILVAGAADPLTPENIGELFDYDQRLRAIPGVTQVDGVFSLAPGLTREEYQGLFSAPPESLDPTLAAGLPLFVRDTSARFSVVSEFETDDTEGQNQVSDVRDVPPPAGMTTLVGGNAADLFDAKASIVRRIPIALGAIAITTFVVLFLVFGSVTLPIKAMIMNGLSLTAAFGAIVFIFQDGRFEPLLGYTSLGTIDVTLPILMFAILFGLSMDYEVLMLSRVREEYVRTGDNTLAVARGLEKTGRLITSAAALLIVVLAAFATSDITLMKTLGVGMALAIAIDATIVRALLVPAAMRLMGDWNWWAPEPLTRIWEKAGLGDLEGHGASSEPVHPSRIVPAYEGPKQATPLVGGQLPQVDSAAFTVQLPAGGAPPAFLATPDNGQRFPLDAAITTIGRNADNHISLADPLVSSQHATIERMADGTMVVNDLDSTNGTFVDGARLSGARRIEDGSVLRFGISELSVKVAAPAVPEPKHATTSEAPESMVEATMVTSALATSLDYLIVVEGDGLGRAFRIEADTTSLGRDPRNEIVISDPKASGFHARIQRGLDGGLIIEDRGSTNGTVINTELLDDTHRLTEDDQIRVGDTILQFKRAG